MADVEYGTLVFDLDGTLVRLAVDWEAVAGAVEVEHQRPVLHVRHHSSSSRAMTFFCIWVVPS